MAPFILRLSSLFESHFDFRIARVKRVHNVDGNVVGEHHPLRLSERLGVANPIRFVPPAREPMVALVSLPMALSYCKAVFVVDDVNNGEFTCAFKHDFTS